MFSFFAQIKDYPAVMWRLAFAMVVIAIGEAFLWPLTMTYITQAFGKSITAAGTVLLLQYTSSLAGNLVGGFLFDRYSGRRITMITTIALTAILLGMAFSTIFPLYVVLLMLYGFGTGIYLPVIRALSVTVWPAGGRRAVNLVYVANNLGVAIGAVCGGLLASKSFQWAFIGTAVAYVLFLLLFTFTLPEKDIRKASLQGTAEKGQSGGAKAARTPFSTWLALGLLTLGLSLLVVTYIQWQTTVPLYMKLLGVSLSGYSMIWTVNGAVIVLAQPLISWLIYRYHLTLKAQILYGTLLFVAAYGLVIGSTNYSGFLLAMAVLTLGEMLVWPGVPAIAAEIATPGRTGMFQGIASSGQSIGRMVGPLIGGTLFESVSPHGMLIGMLVFILAAMVFFFYYDLMGRNKRLMSSGAGKQM